MRPGARRLESPHERQPSQGRRAAHRADRMDAQKPGARTGSRSKPPEAGARSASLEPGRAPGYRQHHSCFPASRRRGRPAAACGLDDLCESRNRWKGITAPTILIATLVAAYLYVVSPGPAFLALFTLAASRGRVAGAWFISGHLVGDVTWGALAVAAIVGANRIGPTLFELLGFGCGLYLCWLGLRAVMTKKDAPPRTIGASRPLATGMAFGLTIPKPIRWRWRCSRRLSRPISASC